MSNNKYIIDKDSLTGIADAVRNKLGTGEATTDSQTGDIIYPEDKGYYLKEEVVAKISGFGWSYTGYSGNFGRNYSPLIEGIYWDEAVGEPWYSVEITLVNVSGNDLYNMDVYYSNGGIQSFTNVRSSTYTVSAPNGSTYFDLYFSNSYSSSRWNGSSSLGSLTAIFKDAEGKPIKPKQSSYQYKTYDSVVHTANFGTADVETPIPLTIDDIQDKITNYLMSSGTGAGLKIFRCYSKNSSTSSEEDGWKVSNYLAISGYYDLNFSSTSPSYITTQIPDLDPERIVFIWFVGRDSRYGYERNFIFEPTLKNVEHYTSASISYGKRLSSATDYYFFPDGVGYFADNSNYGMMGMWDANNKILDLGFQCVSSRSGTNITSTYTSQYYAIPVRLIIVYKA